MENNFKRFLSLMLAMVMVLGMFPMGHVHAEGETEFSTEKIANATFSGSATSEGDIAEVSDGIIDETGNFWTTGSDSGSLTDCYLLAEFDQEYLIGQVDYSMRYDTGGTGGNVYMCTGNLNNYILEYSTDNVTWTPLATGDTTAGTTVIKFAPVSAKYVRLTSTSSYHWQSANENKFMAVGEFAVYQVICDHTFDSCEDDVCNKCGYTREHLGHADENGDMICDNCEMNLCTEHTEVEIPAVAATCIATGLTAGKKCSVCGTITEAQQVTNIDPNNHTVVEIPAVEATFETAGATKGTKCELCDEILTDPVVIPAGYNTGIVPVDKLTATAGSAQLNNATEGGAELALDDKFDTMWHTDWNGTAAENLWIDFALTEDYEVSGLYYKPRSQAGNGTITKYQILVSYDGVNYVEIATGSWDQNEAWKTVTFEAVQVKNVRLVAVESVSDFRLFASAVEIRLVGEATEHAHLFSAKVTDPTCTAAGYTTYTCNCGATYTVAGDAATGHSYTSEVTTPATCTTAGMMTYTCSCGDSYTEEIPATGHTDADGDFDCDNCEASLCEHQEVEIPAVPATCTETGMTAGKKCSVCGEILEAPVEVSALGHKPGEAVIENNVDPTEETDGSYDTVVYCTVCNAEISRETTVVPATGSTEETVLNAKILTNGGAVLALSDCEYVLGGTENAYSLSHGGTYYVKPAASGSSIPQTNGEFSNLTLTWQDNGSVWIGSTLANNVPGGGSIHIWTAGKDVPYWDRCGSGHGFNTSNGTHDLYLFRADENSTNAVIPGYTQVTASDVQVGESYLIAAKQGESTWYIMVPTASAEKFDHIAQLVTDAVTHTHEYTVTTTDATCGANGLKTSTCDCGHIHKEVISATGEHTSGVATKENVDGHGYDLVTRCTTCNEILNSKHVNTIYKSSMTMANSLDMNFAFAMDMVENWTGHYAEIVKEYADGRESVTVTIPYKDWLKDDLNKDGTNDHYFVTFTGIAAKEMTDEIHVTIYDAEGNAVCEKFTDTVRDHAMRNLANNVSPQNNTMIVDMLNYGTIAQQRASYNLGKLANGELSDEQKAYATAAVTNEKVNQVTGDIKYLANVKMVNNLQFMMAFYGIDETMTIKVTFKHWNEQEATTTVIPFTDLVKNGSYYVLTLEETVIADAFEDITVEFVKDGEVVASVTDSIAAYANRAKTATNSELYDAIVKFSVSAKAYLKSKNQTTD